MQVVRLTTKKQFRKFVDMADSLYLGDKFFVPYMRADLRKTLYKLVVKEGTYVALAVEEGGKYLARVLFTVAPSKQLKKEKCGFFSHFECVDDVAVAKLLFGEMFKILRERGADYAEGTYFPYDQDNRRGILVEGFEDEPMILTSYNPRYYGALLEACGFHKDFDTVSYRVDAGRYDIKRIKTATEWAAKRYKFSVAPVDFSRLNDEIDAVHEIITAATDEDIFQDAPTREDLVRIVKNWRSFLWADFIHIARTEEGRPIGVMMSVPNFYTVFRKMNGKLNPITAIKMLYYKKRINSVRAILQYVVPDYQNKGVNFALYHAFYENCLRRGITCAEAGTIMENNVESRRNVESASGILNKVFRIYGREL